MEHQGGTATTGIDGDEDPLFIQWIRASGQDGRRWAQAYARPDVQRAAVLSIEAVGLLKRRRTAAGRAMLDRATEAVDALGGDLRPSLQAVVERFYHGALAYWLYVDRQWDEADATMAFAHDAVVRAVTDARCLLPFAVSCGEFHVNRARIASARGRWAEMREHVETATAMSLGTRPFCTLGDGSEVWIHDIRAYLRSASVHLAEEEWGDLANICDEVRNAERVRALERQLYRLKDFVITYP